jgi:WD40 repeat protein
LSDVFISYSRKDIAFARLLRESLQQNEVDTWIDWERIPVGERWWDEICQAIENANVFMFIISKNSIGSPVCKNEIDHALKNHKRIIPVIVDELAPEAVREFTPELPQINWIVFEKDHLFRIEENAQDQSDSPEDRQVALPKLPQFLEALKKLDQAIHTDWEWVKYHTRLQLNALLWESNQRDPGYLVHGTALEEAEQQFLRASGKDPKPTDLQVEYVTASRKEETQQQEERLKLEQKARARQRLVIWAIGIGLGVAIVLGGLTLNQRNQAISAGNSRATAEANAIGEANNRATAEANAIQQRDIAVARQVAAQARSLYIDHPDEAMLLSIEAQRRLDISEARNSLLLTTTNQPELAHFLWDRGWGWGSVAYSRDGKLLAIGTVDHTVQLLDANTGEPITDPLEGLEGEVTSLVFSPDGRTLIAGDNTGLVVSWTVSYAAWPMQDKTFPLGKSLGQDYMGMGPGMMWANVYTGVNHYLWNSPAAQPAAICMCAITALEFSADGQILAAGLGNGDVVLTRFPGGDVLATLPASNDIGMSSEMIMDLDFSPDAKKLVVSAISGSIHVWDLVQGGAKLLSYNVELSRSALSPDGKTLAYNLGREPSIYLQDMETQKVEKYPLPTGDWIISLAISPDGKTLAVGLADDTIQLWDMQNHQSKGSPLTGHQGEVINLAFNPDGQRLASMDWEHTTIMWDLQAKGRLLTTYEYATDSVTSIALSTDGKYLASQARIGLDGIIHIKDMQKPQSSPKALDVLELGVKPRESDIFFLPGSHSLILDGSSDLSSSTNQILFWDVERNQLVLKIEGARGPYAISPDGKVLAAYNAKKNVALWNAQSGSLLLELENSDSESDTALEPAGAMAFSPDGTLLAIGDNYGTIELRSVGTGKPIDIYLKGHTDQITGLSFSPGGKVLASSSRDRTIRLWNVDQPDVLPVELDGHTSWVTGVAFSPDGRTLVSTSLDGTTRLWDVQNYKNIGQFAGSMIDQTFDPIFDAEGQHLLAGGTKVMDLASLNLEDAYSHRGLVEEWEFNLESWKDTVCSVVNRNLTLSEWQANFGTEPYRKTCNTLELHPSVVERFWQSEITTMASEGWQAALDDFMNTLPLDPALADEIKAASQKYAITDIISTSVDLVRLGEVDSAVDTYRALHSMGIDTQMGADTWNEVCWYGSLWNQAAKVLDICELAVSLDPQNANIRDSRGVARASTGDFPGAIEDFQAFVNANKNSQNETMVSEVGLRKSWISALNKGQNPFSELYLHSLLNP